MVDRIVLDFLLLMSTKQVYHLLVCRIVFLMCRDLFCLQGKVFPPPPVVLDTTSSLMQPFSLKKVHIIM